MIILYPPCKNYKNCKIFNLFNILINIKKSFLLSIKAGRLLSPPMKICLSWGIYFYKLRYLTWFHNLKWSELLLQIICKKVQMGVWLVRLIWLWNPAWLIYKILKFMKLFKNKNLNFWILKSLIILLSQSLGAVSLPHLVKKEQFHLSLH